jgi:hypothetical protein
MGMLFRPRPSVVNLAAEAQRSAVGADAGAAGGRRTRPHSDVASGTSARSSASNHARAALLVRAIEASVSGSSVEICDLYTPDVEGWSPNGTVTSAAELAVEFEDRDDAFSDVEVVIVALDVGGDQACAEWVASVVHTGPLTQDGVVVVPPTGMRLTLRGVTVAEFDGDHIRSFRQYWNELEWLDQLHLLAGDRPEAPG